MGLVSLEPIPCPVPLPFVPKCWLRVASGLSREILCQLHDFRLSWQIALAPCGVALRLLSPPSDFPRLCRFAAVYYKPPFSLWQRTGGCCVTQCCTNTLLRLRACAFHLSPVTGLAKPLAHVKAHPVSPAWRRFWHACRAASDGKCDRYGRKQAAPHVPPQTLRTTDISSSGWWQTTQIMTSLSPQMPRTSDMS